MKIILSLIISVGLSFLILIPNSNANPPCASYYPAPTYYPPTTYYSTPTYYPTQTYVAPTYVEKKNYDVSPVVVVGVPVSSLGLDYYYSVGDELREEVIADKVAARLSRSRQEVTTTRTVTEKTPGFYIERSTQQAAVNSQGRQYQQTAGYQQTVQGSGQSQNVVSAEIGMEAFNIFGEETQQAPGDYHANITSLFSQACSRCHKQNTDKPGSINLFSEELNKDDEYSRRERVYNSVRPDETGKVRMPRNGQPLNENDLNKIREWFREVGGQV
jgi:mono/diheme cytochrome c family protein